MDNNRTKQKIRSAMEKGIVACVYMILFTYIRVCVCVCVCKHVCVGGGSCVRQDEFRERCSEFHKGEHFLAGF